MQARFASAVLLGFVLIAAAACSGSDGLTEAEEEALQERVEQAELEAAEAERRRQAAEEARKKAEEEAVAAEQAEQEAEDDAAEAERLRQEAEEERQAAEAARQRLAAEAEARRKADAAERARTAIVGSRTIGAAATIAVGDIEYGEPAPVTTPPGPFTTTEGRSGRWSTTSLTAIAEPTRDMIQIYSDVEAPTSVPFKDSEYNTNNAVVNAEGMVLPAGLALGTDNRDDAASGSFDRTSAPPKSFDMVDRGEHETAQERTDAISTAQGNFDNDPSDANRDALAAARASRVRDTDRYPYRWAAETTGTLGGASGRFRCSEMGSTADTSCTVTNTGGGFVFAGPWYFVPSSGTVGVRVEDAEYMWFGVWARQTVRLADPPDQPTETWAFQAKHGGNDVTDFGGATGTATYNGPAFGRYAVYEPDTGDSGIGTFTASATLVADFDAAPNTVAGSITNFSNDPSWSLALKRKDIASGVAAAGTDDVTWTIDGLPDDSGTWEAAFYSNLPTDTPGLTQVQPHGIAGTFEAEYDPSGAGERAALIGAFGAHRP